MKLSRIYDMEDYEKAITIVSLHYEDRDMKIEHETKLDEARSKMNNSKRKQFSKPEFSN
jgi:hypothetical protein